jgi:hypothetical protein
MTSRPLFMASVRHSKRRLYLVLGLYPECGSIRRGDTLAKCMTDELQTARLLSDSKQGSRHSARAQTTKFAA